MRTVIMGGTSGIGLAAAERLAGEGDEVIVTGRDPARLAAVKPLVASAEQVDGTDAAATGAFFARLGTFEHLVLAYSPGPVGLGPVGQVSAADVRAAFEGKLFGYLSAIRQASVSGSVTMVAAASARAALPGTTVLAAVNGAIERIVPPLAAELAPVRVNVVSPGVVDTPWWSFLSDVDRQAQFDATAGQLPAGRVATVDDVARAIAYLVRADYVTGSVMPVDGGFTMC